MKAFGYPWESESETPDQLEEVSVVCTKGELDGLIRFLEDVRREVSGIGKVDGEHWHYRDWTEKWTGKQPDLIVVLNEES